ncbi:MAG: imidazole glycerol phosphate synthase subunit HisH [Candidatus Sumerlaeota bacterium]
MIAIADYKAGNLRSVQRACHAVGAQAEITPDPEIISAAERVIFPGVGTAPSAMQTLNESGLADALREVQQKGTPLMGICLGTQIILEHSEEGNTDCLGLLEGKVTRFRVQDPALKIPHIGWNAVHFQKQHDVLKDIPNDVEFYFVHSYHPSGLAEDEVLATTEYEEVFPSVLARDNVFATQFHPEKSGRYGLQLLSNFLNWRP